MYEQYINIYQKARESVGLTQEKAAERIGVSIESIRMYEGGKRIPPDDVVFRMIDIYNTQYLAYQHLRENVITASAVMPMNIKVTDLPQAILRIQKEITDFLQIRDEMISITYDGIISADERPRWNVIVKELNDIMEAIMSLRFVPTQAESIKKTGKAG